MLFYPTGLPYCFLAQSVGQNPVCSRGQKEVKASLVPKGLQDYPLKLCEVIHTKACGIPHSLTEHEQTTNDNCRNKF